METRKNSKLRRYKVLFFISALGFVLVVIASFLYFKLDLPPRISTILGPVLGMIAGLSFFGSMVFGGLALSESGKNSKVDEE